MSQIQPFNPETSPWFRTHPKLGVDLMDHLFARLEMKYPRLWSGAFKNDAAVRGWKEAWAETFEREGLTSEDIKRGLDNVARMYPDYPPTEGQFLLCCRPATDYEAMFLEALEQMRIREDSRGQGKPGADKWSHPAVYWAAVAIGWFDLRNATYAQIQRRWVAAVDKVMANKPVRPVPEIVLEALPAPGKTSVSPEEAKRRLDEMRAIMRNGVLARSMFVAYDNGE